MQLFPKTIDDVKDMIEEYRNTAGTENIQTIDMMAAEIFTFEERLIKLEEKLDAHIKSHKQRPKASEAEPEQTGNVSYNSSAINDNSSAINDNIKEMALPILDNPRMKDEVAAIKKILIEQNPDFIKNIEVQAILKKRFHYTICDTRTASEREGMNRTLCGFCSDRDSLSFLFSFSFSLSLLQMLQLQMLQLHR